MVPSCYTKNSRRGGLSLAAAIQRGEALRKETLLEQLLGIHPGNQFATASHYHGPRFQYKEQSNYSTAQGLAYRQLIPHTCMYEYTSLGMSDSWEGNNVDSKALLKQDSTSSRIKKQTSGVA